MKKIISILACVCLLLSVVIVPVSAAETSATITFDDKSKRTTFDSSVQQIWEEDGITVTNKKGSYNNALGDYANPARFYAGTETVIEYPGMTSIVVTAGSAKYANVWSTSNADANATVTVDGSVATITFATAVDSYTVSMSAQTRVASITVYAASAAGGCTHDETTITSNGDETHSVVCNSCGEAVSTVDCKDSDLDGVCDTCEGDVALPETLTITEAVTLGAEQATGAYTADKYFVTGQITAIANTTYGNMYIADEDGNEIYIYGLYNDDGTVRYDALDAKPDEGDIVKVLSTVGNYNGTAQLKNAWLIEFTAGELEPTTPDPEADSELTIEAAIALGESKKSNVYTENKYYVTGTVTEVYNETYGNMYIADENGNTLTVYGTYSADGSTGYADMETKPVAGDTVTVYGVIGNYGGAAQMKNGWITEIVPVVGTADKPEVLELQSNPMMPQFPPSAQAQIELEAENDGYYYTITATEDGAFVLNVSAFDAEYNSVGYQFSVTNTTTGTAYDAVIKAADSDLYYDSTMVPVVAGDTIVIKAGTYAAEAAAPAGTLSVNIGFAAVGSYDLPEVLELQANPMMPQFPPSAQAQTELEAGNQGYYYTIVAEEDGAFVISVSAYDAEYNSVGYQLNATNVATNYQSDYIARATDAEDYYDAIMVPVSAGDEVIINAGTFNPEDAWNAPAGTLNVRINFATVGSYDYPEVLELQANPMMPQFPPSANAETELEAGNQGYYYTITATEDGAFIINVSAIDAEWNSVGYQFNVTNTTTNYQTDYIARGADAEDYYDSVMVPVSAGDEIIINAGTFNPEDAWNAPAGTLNVRVNFAAVGSYEYPANIDAAGDFATTVEAESQGYYYQWVATEDSVVTVTMNDESGWMYSISKTPVDEEDYGAYYNGDTHWYDDETVVTTESIKVYAGETVTVWVNTYDPESPWAAPEGTVNWTFDFETITLGDANGDGKVNAQDYATLMQYLNEWDGVEVNEFAADVNGDGKLNGRDCAFLLQYLNEWDVVLK